MITEILLKDRTTGNNILWANAEFGNKQIDSAQVDSIKPRHEKIREHQKQRTRDRAEIFTPPEVCKIQNDLIIGDERDWQAYQKRATKASSFSYGDEVAQIFP